MKWQIAAVGMLTILAGCVLDRAGLVDGGQGGSGGAGAAGSGGQGGGEAGMGGTGGAAPFCGDGEVNQPSEECDGGEGTPVDTITCDADCTMAECGDGDINQVAGEGCDDGNTSNGDGCSDQCVLESCGNSVVDPGEECDDGPGNNNDDCLDTCLMARCGDGFLHNEESGNEQCDDGDGLNNDSCPDGPNGTCEQATCGDGHTWDQDGGNEQCDDDNSNQNDDCLDDCTAASCGDGHVHNQGTGNEQCDDNNNNQNDDCLNDCTAASCGDGHVHNQGSGNEQCDDSNTNNSDGCSSVCDREAGYCCTGEPSTCVTGPFNLTGAALNNSIPDDGHPNNRACETFTFSQMGCGNVADVNVTLGINHTFVNDLIVRIEGANMTVQNLMALPPSTANLSAGSPVTYDDEAATSAALMGMNLSNNQTVCLNSSSPCEYSPDPGSLGVYDGSSPVGTWEVCVSDSAASDTGTLQSVDIEITTQ